MLFNETPRTLREAAARIPRLNGRKVHASSVWRWGRKGVGTVKLELWRIGGRFVTSDEARERFFCALAAVEPRPASPKAPTAPNPASPAQRQRDIERAKVELRKAGI